MRNVRHRLRSSPLATIAMVTYNSGRYVREAIESVLAQDYEDFELLVCDDCSRDDTWEIVKSFGDRRIRAVRNDSNLGEYLNRNKALALARGKYLMYIDGDDLMYAFALGMLVRTMERFPDAGFAAALPPSEKFVYPVELTAGEYCRCTFLGPIILASDFTQLFFRTAALRGVGGFDLRYRTGDLHIQYLMGSRGNALLVANGLAWWRKRRGQASESLRASGQPLVEMWRYGREILDEAGCPLDAREKALARENLTRMLLRNSVRMLLRGEFWNAVHVALDTGIPLREWHSILHPYRKPYLSQVTGDDPIRLGIGRAPPSAAPARALWRFPGEIAPVRALDHRPRVELAAPAE